MTDAEAAHGQKSAPWRIIGIGSPVTGDDLGWLAIDLLRTAGFDRHAELLTLDRPGTELLEYLQPGTRVILIDAMDAGLPPGSIGELVLDDLLVTARGPSSHGFGLAETLALGNALGTLPQSLRILGIQAGGQANSTVPIMAESSLLSGCVQRILDNSR